MSGTQQQPVPPLSTILVVEDDRDTCEFVVLLLSVAGYQTLEATTGAAALSVVAGQPVHAILLDLRLPDQDGLAVCRHLRANGHPELPIILMTAGQTPDVQRRAQEAGVTALLAKPFAPDVLLERVASLLQAP